MQNRQAIFRGRRALLLVLCSALALLFPMLGAGFYADDYLHQTVLRGLLEAPHMGPLAMFEFGRPADWMGLGNPLGSLPWWVSEDWSVHFFRPLSSLSLWLDYRLFGAEPLGYHLVSLAWYLGVLLAAHRLYVLVGLDKNVALLALGVFALTNAAFLPVGWVANRSTVIEIFFVLLAVNSVMACESRVSVRAIGLALLCGLVALGVKESGVAAFVLVAYSLLLVAKSEDDVEVVRRARWGVVLCLLCVLAFLAFLSIGDHGTTSVFYSSPWEAPLSFVRRIGVLLSAGLLRLIFPMPLDAVMINPDQALAQCSVAALLMAPVVWAIGRTLWHDKRAGFFAFWLCIELLPQAAAPPSDRLLFGAAIGSAGLLALFLHKWWGARASHSPGMRRGASAVVGICAVASTMNAIAQPIVFRIIMGDVRASILATEVGEPHEQRRELVVLQASNAMVPFGLQNTWAVESSDQDLRFWIMQMGRLGFEWTRVDERTCIIRSSERPFLQHMFESVYRASPLPQVGEHFSTELFDVQIISADECGPRELRITFQLDMDASHLMFLVNREGRLVVIKPPAIGASLLIEEAEPQSPFDI